MIQQESRVKKYFSSLLSEPLDKSVSLVLCLHLLEDRPLFIGELSSKYNIDLIIGIPYSAKQEIVDRLKVKFSVVIPDMKALQESSYLLNLIEEHVDPDRDFVICEIGGYFSSCIKLIKEKRKKHFLGCVEDTEAGHRKYEACNYVDKKVTSIARSANKHPEDFMVGASCIYSLENIIRKFNITVEGKNATVLGFGIVGQGLAFALKNRGLSVTVFDTDPSKRLLAISLGFSSLELDKALGYGDFIFGATANFSIGGEKFKLIKHGSYLVSCSSKQLEFDLKALSDFVKKDITENLARYISENKEFYLVSNGFPVNFIDDAAIGPLLYLSQGELIAAIEYTAKEDFIGIKEVDNTHKDRVVNNFLNIFVDKNTGKIDGCI